MTDNSDITYAVIIGYEWFDNTYTEMYEQLQTIKKNNEKLDMYSETLSPKMTILAEDNLFNEASYAILGSVLHTSESLEKNLAEGYSKVAYTKDYLHEVNTVAKECLPKLSIAPKLIFAKLYKGSIWKL